MKKEDFTPEFVTPVLANYIINQNFPQELYEIGSKVYITGVSTVELEPVKEIGGKFRVEGTADVGTQTDMGEGDSSESDYPMSFSLDFDGGGNIVHRHTLKIDTSSFFE
jgi:Predicted pPIWI-associating nuclease